MRSLAGLLVVVGAAGCVSFPSAHLVTSRGASVQVAAPVVCGPVGFRRVPLQARWGEFVRVTVAAPVVLRGSVLVHANGVGREPRAWRTDVDGSLVVEARFENLDPDRRFALDDSRPIDLTITGLEAPAGGTCEGAVFTVEQGALVPTIGERAWVAELERRGGPELAARREALRVEMEARRQAHYAAWEAQRRVHVASEVAAERTLVREAHYAAWEARRAASASAEVEVVAGVDLEGVAGGGAGAEAEATAAGADALAVTAGAAGGGSAGLGAGTVVGATCTAAGGGAAGSGAVAVAGGAPSCGSLELFRTAAVEVRAPSATDAQLRAQAGAAWSQSSDAQLRAQAGAAWAQPSDAQFRAQAGAAWAQPSDAQLRAQAGAAWAQSSDAQLRAQAGAAWAQSSDAAWAQPSDAQFRAQAAAPHLEPVVVSSESQVAVAASACTGGCAAQAAVAAPACTGGCEAQAAFSVALPVFFHALFNAGAAAAPAPPPGRQAVHRAVPVGAR